MSYEATTSDFNFYLDMSTWLTLNSEEEFYTLARKDQTCWEQNRAFALSQYANSVQNQNYDCKRKEFLNMINCDCPFSTYSVCSPQQALDCCDAPVPCTPYKSTSLYDDLAEVMSTSKKKDNNMRAYSDSYSAPTASVSITADAFSPEKTAQDRLTSRALYAFREKGREMEKTYHLYDDNAPKTIKEMLDRVKAGDYKFDADYKDEFILSRSFDSYDSQFRYFDWRKVPADQDGYCKAYALLDKAHDELVDTITVLGAKEGLAALRAFEAQSFTVQ